MIDKIIDSIIWYIPIKKLRNSIRELLLHYNSQIEDLKFNNYNTVKTLHNDINDNLHCIKDNLNRLQNSINDLHFDIVNRDNRYYDVLSDMILYRDKKKVFLLETSEHPNIGDSSIVYASKLMLENIFPNNIVIEYSDQDIDYTKNIMPKFINDDDIIFLHGGGNIGNIWIYHENTRRYILKNYLNNRIIIFPQSINFSNDEDGLRELEISKQIYNAHNNLTIMVRDEKSYEFASKHFYNNKIFLVPDIVLSLYNNINFISSSERKGVILLFRDDKEKILDNSVIEDIKNYLDVISNEYVFHNNMMSYIPSSIKIDRKYIVVDQLNNISKYKLCITDRLHGAIFSYITNTPCIVFKSSDHKIEYGLKFLKDVDSITYVGENQNIDYIKEIINKYLDEKYKVNNNIDFNKIIKELIIDILNK